MQKLGIALPPTLIDTPGTALALYNGMWQRQSVIPSGVDIGALSPEEIAVSVVAELIAVRRNAASASHKKLNYEARPALSER